ncbi:superoxide dismutase family protein [uncultured Parasphingopyxis sp.]|uniref:superoxide dismutase family protein n=1 Tax=uncultured Parasphingopyxis sp. TaxID=1547918 RepID=UPI00261382E1|nr:superoxide dismutase family protein [uncultured Parasphingopyxis sp.]
MNKLATAAAMIAAAGLSGCMNTGGMSDIPPPNSVDFARADLADASGMDRGAVTFEQLDTGVRVVIEGRGLTPGAHGAHIHMTGSCVAPDFTSAGGHWNPMNREHGRENPAGQHMGDMPNLIVGQDGSGVLELVVEGARITGGTAAMLDGDGAAVVIHAGPDDYRTDPAGDAGSRVACGEVYAAM